MINKKILIIILSILSGIHFSFLLIRNSSLDFNLGENILFSLTFVVSYLFLLYLPIALFFSLKSKKRYFALLFLFVVMCFMFSFVYGDIKKYQTRDDLKSGLIEVDMFLKKDMFASECENWSPSIKPSVCECVNYDYKKKEYRDNRLYAKKLDMFSFFDVYYELYPDEELANSSPCKNFENGCGVYSKKAFLEYEKYEDEYRDSRQAFCNSYYLEKFGEKPLNALILKQSLYSLSIKFNFFARLLYAGAM